MNKRELLALLETLPDFDCPIIIGRKNPKISVSVAETATVGEGWTTCPSPGRMYPEGTRRVVYTFKED